MPASRAPDESHFFVAVCAHRPQVGNLTFVYVPRAANVLRERERHIALLEAELSPKDRWLENAQNASSRDAARTPNASEQELERSNHWAEDLNREVEARRARIAELQDELAHEQAERAPSGGRLRGQGRATWRPTSAKKRSGPSTLETSLKADIAKQTAELGRAVEALHHTEKELDDRTAWARRLEAEAQQSTTAGHALPRIAMGETRTQGRPRSGIPRQLKWPS